MIAFVAAIPARLASTRLPGKPLADIDGRPMVVHVAERAAASGAREVWIATDDPAIVAAAAAHGVQAALTRNDHPSGTDRIAELCVQQRWPDDTIVVNVQGDEPLIDPALIAAVARRLHETPDAAIATACHALHSTREMFDPNVVKVVLDRRDFALYFSRAPIPYARDAFAPGAPAIRAAVEQAGAGVPLPAGLPVYRHVGLYAYRVAALRRLSTLPPTALEQFESLEQLRALWHGEAIVVEATTAVPAAGVDTLADLERVRAALAQAAGR